MSPAEAFSGGTAVITGAGSGIGEGIARVAARLGMNVVLADVVEQRIARVAAEIEAEGGTALPVTTDVTDLTSLERLANVSYEQFGEVRLVVNNAGIETIGYSWDIPAEVWDRLLNINVRGVVHGSRIFSKRMLASGKPGYIANVASVGAVGMMPTHAPYMISKHAVLSFTECLFLEMQLIGALVHVAAVIPAQVATRIFADAPADRGSEFVEKQCAMMNAMLEDTGLHPQEAADIILKGIASKQFWVSTHPQTTAYMAKARADYLASLATPSLAEEARAIVAAAAAPRGS
jgi:NAD(P)-dependent dehydrogenase (short-subunit alcohol dehydrogenase family)